MSFDLPSLGNLAVIYGIRILSAIVIALIGWWLAGAIERITHRALLRTAHMDVTVGAFLSSLIYYAALVVTFVVILQIVGIEATSLVAVLGAASLAVGLALQGTLSNMAAGVMLLIFRPLRIGDSIEVAGKSGTVKNLNLFMTELASADNVQVLIPNGQVWGTAMTNFSVYPTRRVSVTFVVPLDRDPEGTAARLLATLKGDQRVLGAPPPNVAVSNITDKGAEITMEAWASAADAGAVRTDYVRQSVDALKPR
jgi:small conductance mechanosensitive channel